MAWLVFILIAAISASAMAILEKKLLFKKHALEYLTLRTGYVSLFCAITLLILHDIPPLSTLAFIYVVALAGTAGLLYRTKAARHMEISIVSPMMNLSPLFVLILAFFFLGERLTHIQVAGVLLMLVGAYILEIQPKHTFFEPLIHMIKSKYVHYLLFALITLSFTAIADKYIITNLMEPMVYVLYLFLFIGINFFIIEYTRFGFTELKHNFHGNQIPFIITSALTLITAFLTILAVSLQQVSLVVPFKRLSTLFSTIVGGELFHEQFILRKSIACIIMIAGTVLLIL